MARSTVPYIDVLAGAIAIVSAILAILLHINVAWLVLVEQELAGYHSR